MGGLLLAVSAAAAGGEPPPVLRVYGPGGPHRVIKECAALYQARGGAAVEVYKGGPERLAESVRRDGDLYYAGAEYMIEDFDRRNPGVLDLSTLERLHPRRVGIVVRKGNPLGIAGLADLNRSGLRVLGVLLEDMRDVCGASAGRFWRVVYSGQEGVHAWRSNPELDAWVTYRSWHEMLAGETEFVELPGEAALRFTPIAITRRTEHRREAEAFLAFLKSPEAQEVFHRNGWD